MLSALHQRWLELEADQGDEGFTYARTDLLQQLLTQADQQALSHIAACRQRGIVPAAAIAAFQRARIERDEAEADKVEVLQAYWSASLSARTLVMLAGKPKE